MAAREDERAGGFLSRWARRKAEVQAGRPVAEPVPQAAAPAAPAVPPAVVPATATATATASPDCAEVRVAAADPPPPPPTLEEAQSLTPQSDFRRFVARDVDPAVKNTALKTLFADPHFNVMDGLDIYIDDYGVPDPLPPSMLRQLVQSQALGLFRAEEEEAARASADAVPAAPTPAVHDAAATEAAALPDVPPDFPDPIPEPHEDADLRLQPHDAAGPADAGPPAHGAGEDAGRER